MAPRLRGELLRHQACAMFVASALLGPLCDNFHSQAGVLTYVHPTITQPIVTCWWVPLLFGVAGVIIGVGYPLLDELAADADTSHRRSSSSSSVECGTRRTAASLSTTMAVPKPPPSWVTTLLCISMFVAHYQLSAVLQAPLLAHPFAEDAVLAAFALAIWWCFDGSVVGLSMSALTAAAGPAVEVGLINGLHLYRYAHPTIDAVGIPSWIAFVYFAGGPAVGLLGRRVHATLTSQLERDC